jgi:glycosyltransferase involved in cell wall biosynthesis
LADKLANIGCPRDKLHISPNGVDPFNFVPANNRSSLTIAAVGRLVEKKAPHLTIEAFSRIAADFTESRLEMVGDGPLADVCQATIDRYGLQHKVKMHGVQNSAFVSNLLQRSTLFAQHSVVGSNGDTESFGVSIIEAMAAELPVVTTKHNGFVDTVMEGVTGFLVEEHDVSGMAAAMAKLLAAPDLAVRMGKAGRQRVLNNFTLCHARNRLREIMSLQT